MYALPADSKHGDRRMEIFTPATVGLWGTLGTTMTSLGVVLSEKSQAVLADTTFTETTLVPVGMMLAGIGVTAALVWKVANQKHIVELNMKDLENRIGRLEHELKSVETELDDKQDKLNHRK
jgi:hypothetical protein